MFRGMRTKRFAAAAILGLALLASGCGRSFRPQNFEVGQPLFDVAMERFERGKWGDAAAGFERLTLELSPSHALLPESMYYLGMSRERRGEHLLAAQSFTRLTGSFPSDTLADDGLFQAGMSYAGLWRKPQLDPEYGDLALDAFRTLLSDYPNSSRADTARVEVAELTEARARKDYLTGRFYLRRRYRDSAILYFLSVVERYPTTEAARLSYLGLLDAYRAIGYDEEASEICQTMRQQYASDSETLEACPPAPAVADSTGA